MNNRELWERCKKYLNVSPDIGMLVDISRMDFLDDYLDMMEPQIQKAFLSRLWPSPLDPRQTAVNMEDKQ
jgi:hypothetical protein